MATVLLFDGDCAFCSTSARLLQRWVRPDCLVLPYQHVDLVMWHVTADRAAAEVRFVQRDGDTVLISGGAQAIAEALLTGRQPWRLLGAALLAPGLASVADLGYRWIAANRYRLPGGTPECALDGATSIVGADSSWQG